MGINPRVVIGSLIIKHMCDLSDREVVQQIQDPPSQPPAAGVDPSPVPAITTQKPALITHEGKLIVDATACPQDRSFPAD